MRALGVVAMLAGTSMGVQTTTASEASAFCMNTNAPGQLSAKNGKEKVAWNSTCDADSHYWGKHMDNAPKNGHCIYVEHDIGPWWAPNAKFWNCYDQVWVTYNYLEVDRDNKFRICEPNGLGCGTWHTNKGF